MSEYWYNDKPNTAINTLVIPSAFQWGTFNMSWMEIVLMLVTCIVFIITVTYQYRDYIQRQIKSLMP